MLVDHEEKGGTAIWSLSVLDGLEEKGDTAIEMQRGALLDRALSTNSGNLSLL